MKKLKAVTAEIHDALYGLSSRELFVILFVLITCVINSAMIMQIEHKLDAKEKQIQEVFGILTNNPPVQGMFPASIDHEQ